MRSILAVLVFLPAAGCADPVGPVRLGDWTHVETGLDATILDAAYGDGLWVVVGLRATVATSVDGLAWTPQDAGFDSHVTGVHYSPHHGVFIAASHDETGGSRTVATSPDGRIWTRHTTERPEPMREAVCSPSVCVAVGDEGAVLRTTDLAAWEDVSFTGGGFRWISVIHARGIFVVSGGREQIAVSPDGREWQVRRLGLTSDIDPSCSLAADCNDIDDVSYTGSGYLAVTHPTMGVWASADLMTWDARPAGLPVLEEQRRGLWTTLSAEGVSLVGGGGGKLAASYDGGATWERVETGPGAHDIWATAYGDGRLLVAGEDGWLMITEWR